MLDKVLTGKLTFNSLRPCDLSATKKSEIRAYFENSYDINESIFTALDESAIYKCPDRLRLPLIFYYGHTACVYINKLMLADLIQPCDRINLSLETIFETGVDEMSWDDTENYRMGGKFQWPALDDVIAYRCQVRQLILDIIEKTPLELPITMDSPWWALFMGMEHERIHIETSSVLIRQLPVEMVEKPEGFIYGPMKAFSAVTDNPMLPVPAQDITLGKPTDFPSYGWDDEYGHRGCKVPAFKASKYMITNGEFHEFVKSGSYNKREMWTEEGWQWKEYCYANHPIFWVCDKGCKSRCGSNLGSYSHCHPDVDDPIQNISNGVNGNADSNGYQIPDDKFIQSNDEGGGQIYRLRCMFDVVSMPWDWPVEVNYHEAKAYCMWKGQGYRLPSEAEHNAMRDDTDIPLNGTDCDIIYKLSLNGNLNLQYGSSTPVNLYTSSQLGFHDVMGNAWEWTEDHFNGLPGYKTCPFYDDFSAPCFDGRHNIIMGGSWISTGDEASRFARFAFRRHFMQHCGFRVVKPAESGSQKSPICIIGTPVYSQIDDVVEKSTRSMNGKIVESVPSAYLHYTLDTMELVQKQILLESDCNMFTFRILQQLEANLDCVPLNGRRFLHLGCGVGNLSFRLSDMCDELLATDTSGLLVDLCTKLHSQKSFTLDIEGTTHRLSTHSENIKNNIIFKRFTWLPNEVGFFDVVIATFFDRVQSVVAWTSRLREVIKDQGLLIVVSADKWTENNLTSLLNKTFRLLDVSDILMNDESVARMTTWVHQ